MTIEQASEITKKIFKNVLQICEGIPAEDAVDALSNAIGRVLIVHFADIDQAKHHVSYVATDIENCIEANRNNQALEASSDQVSA